jgi:GT2 family glycosyltransferase
MSRITIITNTIRRPIELVEKSIRASLSQDSSIDVVLVDQNQVPLQFSSDIELNPRFKHQHEVVPSVSKARNLARYADDCEWIIFCDDDGYLDQGYLNKFIETISENESLEVIAGSIKRMDNGDYYSKRHALGGDMKWFWNTKLLMGSNFAIRRNVFEKLGKFDEQFGAGAPFGSSEETDLAWNAFFHGCKMLYVPELVVFHVPPFNGKLDVEIAKAYRYGFGKGRMVRKWLNLGHWFVWTELLEMLVLPLLRILILVFQWRVNELKIQFFTFRGRFQGLLSVREHSRD